MKRRPWPSDLPTSRRVIIRQVLAHLPGLLLFCVLPIVLVPLVVLSDSSPVWLRVAIAAPLALVALWGTPILIRELFEEPTLRLVPRFERPGEYGTYFKGAALCAAFERLNAVAATLSVVPLSAFGPVLRKRGEDRHWHACAEASTTVQALLKWVTDANADADAELKEDLRALSRALAQPENTQARFHLEVVAGRAMNSALWRQLREQGY